MSACLEPDTLVTLAATLEWNPQDGLEHLQRCAACTGKLKKLVSLHQSLAIEIPAPTEIRARLLDGIAVHRQGERHERRLSPVRCLVGLFAGAALYLGLGVLSLQAPLPMGVPTFLLCLVVGSASALAPSSRPEAIPFEDPSEVNP